MSTRPRRTAKTVALAANQELANATNDVDGSSSSSTVTNEVSAPKTTRNARGRGKAAAVVVAKIDEEPKATTSSRTTTKRGAKKETITTKAPDAGDSSVHVSSRPKRTSKTVALAANQELANAAANDIDGSSSSSTVTTEVSAPKATRNPRGRGKAATVVVATIAEEPTAPTSSRATTKRGAKKETITTEAPDAGDSSQNVSSRPRRTAKTVALATLATHTSTHTSTSTGTTRARPAPRKGKGKASEELETVEEEEKPEPIVQNGATLANKKEQTVVVNEEKLPLDSNNNDDGNSAHANLKGKTAVEKKSTKRPRRTASTDETVETKPEPVKDTKPTKRQRRHASTDETVETKSESVNESKPTKRARRHASTEETVETKPVEPVNDSKPTKVARKVTSRTKKAKSVPEPKVEEEKPAESSQVNDVTDSEPVTAPTAMEVDEEVEEEKPTASTTEAPVVTDEKEPSDENEPVGTVTIPKDEEPIEAEGNSNDLQIVEMTEEEGKVAESNEKAEQTETKGIAEEPVVTFPSEPVDETQKMIEDDQPPLMIEDDKILDDQSANETTIIDQSLEVTTDGKEEETTEGKATETVEEDKPAEPIVQNGTTLADKKEPVVVVNQEEEMPLDSNNNDDDGNLAHANLKRKISVEESQQRLIKRPRFQWSTGHLFTMGEQLVGELGPREKLYKEVKVKSNQPGKVKLHDKVCQVVCGAFHTLVINEQGQVVSFGCNDDAALGRITAKPADVEEDDSDDEDYETKLSSKPLPVEGEIKAKVVKVSSGDMHSAALDENGHVFIWGNLKDESNKLGLFLDDPKGSDGYVPTKVPRQIDLGDKKVADIASGSHHFLMLTEDGELFSMGEGSKGQLGRIDAADLETVGTNRDLFIKPQVVKFPESVKISQIFSKQWSSFAVSDKGVLYAWGLNNCFQLGFQTENPVQFDQNTSLNAVASLAAELYPTRVETPKTMSQVVAVSNGQQHVAIVDIDGKVFTCGSATYGKLGHGEKFVKDCGPEQCLSELKQIEPELFGNDRIAFIECGDFSSFAITETGRLYSWGQGSKSIGTNEGEGEDRFVPSLVDSPYKSDVRFFTGSGASQFSAWIGSLCTGTGH